MLAEEERCDGEEQPRTCTARQETVAQISGMALYAQAASDAAAAKTVPAGGVDSGPRLQEGDREAKEEALRRSAEKKRLKLRKKR